MENINAKVIEKICEHELEYLILRGLISADSNNTNEERAENIKALEDVINAVNESSLNNDKKAQLIEYAEKGKEILHNELKKL